jgi:glucose/arabinose dehydrogenase
MTTRLGRTARRAVGTTALLSLLLATSHETSNTENAALAKNRVQTGPVVALRPVVTSGISNPTYVTHAGDGSGRLFVVEQPGQIRVVRDGTVLPTPFLDISSKIATEDVRALGLFSVAFHPQFETNGRFFVHYARKGDAAVVVAEYRATPASSDVAGTAERILFTVTNPLVPGTLPFWKSHHGGQLAFGPHDGMLYISIGDGGGDVDPLGNAQNKGVLLGKILRIDVDSGEPYSSPPDNPYFGNGCDDGCDEVYAYGLRNPWRFSFDRLTHEIYEGDVGFLYWEEVNLIVRGGNYGWKTMEGRHCNVPALGCDRTGLIEPIYEYGHPEVGGSGCSITGGYVYRGTRSEALQGTYLFSDYCTSEIQGLKNGVVLKLRSDAGGPLVASGHVVSFGEDEAGEVYVVAQSPPGIYRLTGPAGPGCSLACGEDLELADSDGDNQEVATFAAPSEEGSCPGVACSPPSGSSFVVGTTLVECVSSSGGGACSFEVTVRPLGTIAVVSASPSTVRRKTNATVVLTGVGFREGTAVSFGPKISVLDAVVIDDTRIDVRIKVKGKAAKGPRDIVVTTPESEAANCRDCLTVTK